MTSNSASLARRQLHSPNANHSIFIIFPSEGQCKPRNNDFFKTWDGFHRDVQKQRLTYRQTDRRKKVKIKKTNTAVVNAGPPGTEYLYYALDMEGVIL